MKALLCGLENKWKTKKWKCGSPPLSQTVCAAIKQKNEAFSVKDLEVCLVLKMEYAFIPLKVPREYLERQEKFQESFC